MLNIALRPGSKGSKARASNVFVAPRIIHFFFLREPSTTFSRRLSPFLPVAQRKLSLVVVLTLALPSLLLLSFLAALPCH